MNNNKIKIIKTPSLTKTNFMLSFFKLQIRVVTNSFRWSGHVWMCGEGGGGVWSANTASLMYEFCD